MSGQLFITIRAKNYRDFPNVRIDDGVEKLSLFESFQIALTKIVIELLYRTTCSRDTYGAIDTELRNDIYAL